MAAKTWDQDFRREAIGASVRALPEKYRNDPFRFSGSFCLPVGDRPLVGWGPGRFMLIAIIVGFALLLGGALLEKIAGPGANRGHVTNIAVCLSVTGILLFFAAVLLYPLLVRRLLRDRADALVRQSGFGPTVAAELNDADRSAMRISIDGCDHVLVAFDEPNRRLMIEGLGARYQIRADDVEEIAPFEWMNHIGVQIGYRIDPQTRLRVVIARVSFAAELRRRFGFLNTLRMTKRNKLLEHSLHALRERESGL